MQTLETTKPFEVQVVELQEWRQRPVKNNFFELVVVREGSGSQCINYNEYPYSSGNVFLLPPLKCHSFQIEHSSRFVFLKFKPEFFLSGAKPGTRAYEWFGEAAYVLSNYNQLPGDIIHSELDRQHIHSITDLILKENQNFGAGSSPLIRSFMVSILEILLRNIRQGFIQGPEETHQDERIVKLLSYINDHLSEPALLKVGQLARTFLLSPNYLSEFFRKNVGMPLKEYIIKAKLKQVEIRLLHSNYTLTEIAEELSFTDVSHLSKTFKRYSGISVREFKKQGEYRLLKRNAC